MGWKCCGQCETATEALVNDCIQFPPSTVSSDRHALEFDSVALFDGQQTIAIEDKTTRNDEVVVDICRHYGLPLSVLLVVSSGP
jgi:hypothetical protein